MTTLIYTCMLWLLFIGLKGAEGYGDCVVFCGEDKVPNATDVMIACVEKSGCSYCRYAPKHCCPDQLQCITPVMSPDERCLVCPGKFHVKKDMDTWDGWVFDRNTYGDVCVYDCNAYRKNEEFDSFDGTNSCKCRKGGKVKCTKDSLPSISEFCN